MLFSFSSGNFADGVLRLGALFVVFGDGPLLLKHLLHGFRLAALQFKLCFREVALRLLDLRFDLALDLPELPAQELFNSRQCLQFIGIHAGFSQKQVDHGFALYNQSGAVFFEQLQRLDEELLNHAEALKLKLRELARGAMLAAFDIKRSLKLGNPLLECFDGDVDFWTLACHVDREIS